MRRGWRLRVTMLEPRPSRRRMLATAPVSRDPTTTQLRPARLPASLRQPSPTCLTGPPAANIRQLVQCGSTMYCGRSFTQIKRKQHGL